MINISIYQDENDRYCGFCCKGHAGYAENGYDIICAAVSVLTMNTVNSVSEFTKDTFSYEEDEKSGYMEFRLHSGFSAETELLMKALVLGLQSVEDAYGRKYIRVKTQK